MKYKTTKSDTGQWTSKIEFYLSADFCSLNSSNLSSNGFTNICCRKWIKWKMWKIKFQLTAFTKCFRSRFNFFRMDFVFYFLLACVPITMFTYLIFDLCIAISAQFYFTFPAFFGFHVLFEAHLTRIECIDLIGHLGFWWLPILLLL